MSKKTKGIVVPMQIRVKLSDANTFHVQSAGHMLNCEECWRSSKLSLSKQWVRP